MSEFLFRQEVAQFQDDPRFGAKIFYQPIQLKVWVFALLVVALGFGGFASIAPLKQTELVRGHLDPTQGATKVFSPASGTLSEVLVSEGQAVRKGQVLGRVLRTTFDAMGQPRLDYSLAQLDAQIAQQSRQRQLILAQSKLHSRQLAAQIAARQEEIDAMRMQLHIAQKRSALSAKDVQRQVHLLAMGQVANTAHERALDSHYALQQVSQSLEAQIVSAAGAALGLQQQLEQEPYVREVQVLEIDSALAQLLARRKELEVGDAFSLIAPSDGVVSNLLVAHGASIDSRVPFLTLLPVQTQLQALLYVPSRALGELTIKQQVLLAYDAYPARVYGYFPAHIERIATTVVDPREHLFPLDVQEPVYLVHAIPDLSSALGNEGIILRSGMQFSAYMVTGEQSLLQRLLAPLMRLRSRM